MLARLHFKVDSLKQLLPALNLLHGRIQPRRLTLQLSLDVLELLGVVAAVDNDVHHATLAVGGRKGQKVVVLGSGFILLERLPPGADHIKLTIIFQHMVAAVWLMGISHQPSWEGAVGGFYGGIAMVNADDNKVRHFTTPFPWTLCIFLHLFYSHAII